MADDPRVRNLAADEVARGIAEGKILLVDVREPKELAVERYPDAFHLPHPPAQLGKWWTSAHPCKTLRERKGPSEAHQDLAAQPHHPPPLMDLAAEQHGLQGLG